VESSRDLRGRLERVQLTWTGPWSMIGRLAGEPFQPLPVEVLSASTD
jgi:hypothetical protein